MKNRPTPMRLLGQPLFRLLAINLALGTATAVLMLGGLLALNPHGLRDLIFSDRSPGVALGLLLFGLVITFGSVVMGSAIMAIGSDATAAAARHPRAQMMRGTAEAVRPARSPFAVRRGAPAISASARQSFITLRPRAIL
jgi:hypothetical protein